MVRINEEKRRGEKCSKSYGYRVSAQKKKTLSALRNHRIQEPQET